MKGRKTWTKRKKSIQNDDIDGGGDNNVWAPNKSNSIVANPCRVYVCDSQKHTHPHIHTHIQQQQQHTISQMEQNQIYTRNIWYIGNVVWHNITQQRNEEKKAPQKPNAQERREPLWCENAMVGDSEPKEQKKVFMRKTKNPNVVWISQRPTTKSIDFFLLSHSADWLLFYFRTLALSRTFGSTKRLIYLNAKHGIRVQIECIDFTICNIWPSHRMSIVFLLPCSHSRCVRVFMCFGSLLSFLSSVNSSSTLWVAFVCASVYFMWPWLN